MQRGVTAGAIYALGNFDGVHIGHQDVIGRAIALARRRGANAGVLTFNPHPARFFKPDLPPFSLTSPAQKAALVKALGIDTVISLPFDRALADLSAEAFVARYLAGELAAGGIVCGYDFTFGKGRGGTTATLVTLGQAQGFSVEIVSPVSAGPDEPVTSSSLIRNLLREGRPEAAAALLGRWWRIEGTVDHGDKRGRTIGVPTANIALGDYLRPRFGVYAIRAALPSGELVDGVANIGNRPTAGGSLERLEAHLFDFDGDLYGQWLGVDLIGFIRPELKFDSFDALKGQISADADQARALLRAPSTAGPG